MEDEILNKLAANMTESIARFEHIEAKLIKFGDTLECLSARTVSSAPDTAVDRSVRNEMLIWIIGALMIAQSVFLILRLGPGGYSLADAQYDRGKMCAAIGAALPEGYKWECPWATGIPKDKLAENMKSPQETF